MFSDSFHRSVGPAFALKPSAASPPPGPGAKGRQIHVMVWHIKLTKSLDGIVTPLCCPWTAATAAGCGREEGGSRVRARDVRGKKG